MNANLFLAKIEKLKNGTKQHAIEMLKKDGNHLKYLSDDFKNDKEIVMTAVKQNGHSIAFASTEMKNNMEIAMVALKSDGFAFKEWEVN
jgi:hypothetical protein